MKFAWLVARRYLRSPYKPAVLRLVTMFSVVGIGAGVRLGAAAGLGAAAPRGRQDARAAVAAVLAGVLRAGAARAVHDAPFMPLGYDTEAGEAMEASTRRMSRTVRTVPPSVPVTFDFPVRG